MRDVVQGANSDRVTAAGADERMEIGGRVSWWIDAVAASVLTSGRCIDATY
ncbi:hypothetical protein [Clostridium sp. AF50-3]|uniref:hypothetical protein n=1 Tax=Clostridium sp. AF50-3 TaxID=2293021 RepID=UPI0015FB865F|nr:hypothetical protein [Clostridium sp. AF50-3]